MSNHQILWVEDGRHVIGRLWRRQVHLWFARPFQPPDLHVADNTNHGPRSIEMAERLADGILTRPVALRERGADDGDPGAIAGVCILDIPALAKGTPHRLEILRR